MWITVPYCRDEESNRRHRGPPGKVTCQSVGGTGLGLEDWLEPALTTVPWCLFHGSAISKREMIPKVMKWKSKGFGGIHVGSG